MTTALQPIDLSKMRLEPAALFAPGGLDALIERIEGEARSLVPDLRTAKGRKAIASTAARVARSKTYLDSLGKDLVSGLKQQAATVDAERRALRERLDALRDEVRKPLTDWEQAEADRQETIRQRLEDLSRQADGCAAEIAARVAEIEATPIDDTWQEFAAEAAKVKDAALARARTALADAQEREEAERQRLDAEEQARREHEERIRQEAAEQATREAEARARAEAERVEAERAAERQRQEEARLDAERRAREAERRRQREAEQAEHQRLEDEARAHEQAEAAARAERDRIAAEQRQRQEDEARRAADREHRAAVHRDIAAELTLCDLTADQARAVVVAIAQGQVPHLRITY